MWLKYNYTHVLGPVNYLKLYSIWGEKSYIFKSVTSVYTSPANKQTNDQGIKTNNPVNRQSSEQTFCQQKEYKPNHFYVCINPNHWYLNIIELSVKS